MDLFPAFWRLTDRPVILTGGGDAAVNKLRLLASAGARVTIFAVDPSQDLLRDARKAGASVVRRPVLGSDVFDAVLAIVADDSEEEAERSTAQLRQKRVPVNAVDRPTLCDFSVPAIVDRGAVVVGVATGGASPILAQRVRQTIEAVLPARLDALARFARDFRTTVMAVIEDPKARRRFWERVIDGQIATDVLDGRDSRAREQMLSELNGSAAREAGNGRVIVVGIGPGDPEHLTLKALRALLVADVLVTSESNAIAALDYARRDAERIQGTVIEAANAVEAALRDGKVAVRLVPGDGADEAARLSRILDVEVEYVPGVAATDRAASLARAV